MRQVALSTIPPQLPIYDEQHVIFLILGVVDEFGRAHL